MVILPVVISSNIIYLVKFLREANELASQGKMADLLLGNNVLAHVPDINDFVRGLKILFLRF
jgi:2-polyprenyl-3-methyl-5-hydroxy-6-metoxy-1,4-benzoquinol methylase